MGESPDPEDDDEKDLVLDEPEQVWVEGRDIPECVSRRDLDGPGDGQS